MKIENEVLNFHPLCQFDKLQLNPLQQQYLAHLRGGDTIQRIVELFFKSGWLVDFQSLYNLIKDLVQNNWILNPEVVNYFKSLHIKNDVNFKTQTENSSEIKKKETNYNHESLSQLPFFRSLPEKLTDFLLKSSKIIKFEPESLMCKAGDRSRDLYVLLSGQAAIYKQGPQFRQFIAILSDSSVFGEAGFLLGEPRTSDIIALKRSDVLVVPYQADVLDQFLNKDKAQQLQQRFWVQHALLHSDLFKNFPADCLDALTFSGKIIELQDQQLLFNQGDISHSAFVVIQGSLSVRQNDKVINTLVQGAFLGEVSLMISGGRRTASVYGHRKTLLLEINKDNFYKILSQNLYLAKEIQLLATQRAGSDGVRPINPINK